MTNVKSLNFNLILVFDAIMRFGNLTKAGQAIGLSQPGMSYALKQLRHLCQDELFLKTNTGMMPTEHALHIHRRIQPALFEIQESLRPSQAFDPNSTSNQFKIGMPDYTAYLFLNRIHKQLKKESPESNLKINAVQAPERSKSLRDGVIDLAICVHDEEPELLKFEKLYEEEIVCLFDPKYHSFKSKISLKAYSNAEHLLLDFREALPKSITQALKKQKLKRFVAITSPFVASAAECILGSNLLCAYPKKLAELVCQQYDLKCLPLPIKLPKYPIYLSWHARTDTDPAQRWIRNLIQSVVS